MMASTTSISTRLMPRRRPARDVSGHRHAAGRATATHPCQPVIDRILGRSFPEAHIPESAIRPFAIRCGTAGEVPRRSNRYIRVARSPARGGAAGRAISKEKDPRLGNHGSGSGSRSVGLWGGGTAAEEIGKLYCGERPHPRPPPNYTSRFGCCRTQPRNFRGSAAVDRISLHPADFPRVFSRRQAPTLLRSMIGSVGYRPVRPVQVSPRPGACGAHDASPSEIPARPTSIPEGSHHGSHVR
jgi:hypothetical protein